MDSFDTLIEIDSIHNAESVKCDIQDFKIKTENFIHNLIIATQNIRSIYKNLDDLLVTLLLLTHEVDILILTECRLHSAKYIPQITNYVAYQTTNLLNQNDGVVIYVKNNLSANIKELNLINATGLQINIKNYIILGIYRSPSFVNASNFINSLDSHLQTLKNNNNILILGDINIDLICSSCENSNERRNRLNYLNALSAHSILPAHNLPTRFESCLDHVLLKLDKKCNSAYVAVLNTTVTDHNLVALLIAHKYNIATPRKYKTVVDYDTAYNALLCSDVSHFNTYKDPNTYANALIGMIRAIVQNNSKLILVPKCKRAIKPWINAGALKCINLRNKLHKKLQLDTNNRILIITYKRFRNFCSNLLRKLKRLYNKDKINKSLKKPKALWSAINDVTQYKTPKTSNTDLLTIQPCPQASINHVNKYFINIGLTLANKNQKSYGPPINNNSGCCSHRSSFVLFDTTPQEVEATLMGLDSGSAPGWDAIPTQFLKRSRDILVPLISNLANLCFNAGIFPDTFKRSIVTPVYKGGDRCDVNNYRPISVLTSISKIIEKLLNTRLVSFLDKYNLLANSQYGFRKGRSTQDACIDLTTFITKEMDRGKKCLVVFLDLKKAFDTVSVTILVNRLESLGIRDTALSLFSSYLTNRKQLVKIDQYLSDELNVTFGVPQGSVLGPTLFLIYINDLCNLRGVGGRILSYADDTAIAFTGTTWNEVKVIAEEGLAKVSQWLNNNMLTLNLQKTNFVCFAPYNKSQPATDFIIKLHNFSSCNSNYTNCSCPAINKVSCVKYLGVMVDQRLSWHPHLELTMSRVRKLIWVFKTLRHVMDADILNKAYTALAQSIITYCIPVWGGANKTKFLDLERAQRSLIKVMYFKPYRFPTDSLYAISNLLSVRKLYILHLILKFHKFLPFDNTYVNRRRKNSVAPTHPVRSAFAQRQYLSQASYIYNKINRLHQIYPLTLHNCKLILIKWLQTLNYTEVEDLLARQK